MSIRTRLSRLETAHVEAIDAEIVAEARRLGMPDAELGALAAEVMGMSDEELLAVIAAANGRDGNPDKHGAEACTHDSQS